MADVHNNRVQRNLRRKPHSSLSPNSRAPKMNAFRRRNHLRYKQRTYFCPHLMPGAPSYVRKKKGWGFMTSDVQEQVVCAQLGQEYGESRILNFSEGGFGTLFPTWIICTWVLSEHIRKLLCTWRNFDNLSWRSALIPGTLTGIPYGRPRDWPRKESRNDVYRKISVHLHMYNGGEMI